MKRRVRFIFPKRSAPTPVEWVPFVQPAPMQQPPQQFGTPHPMGGTYCPSCGAHWPSVWLAVVPPCRCVEPWLYSFGVVTSTSNRSEMMVETGRGHDDGRPVVFFAPLAGGAS